LSRATKGANSSPINSRGSSGCGKLRQGPDGDELAVVSGGRASDPPACPRARSQRNRRSRDLQPAQNPPCARPQTSRTQHDRVCAVTGAAQTLKIRILFDRKVLTT
jgi:hypothetical protein